MNAQSLSTSARQVEALLDSAGSNPLLDDLRSESSRSLEASGLFPSNYDLFVVRRNNQLGSEIFGPKSLHLGTYSEETLYGSAVGRFRYAMESLKARADRVLSSGTEDVEYGYQVALLWAEIGKLKELVGTSLAISEIVAEFRTARFQFLGVDTPLGAVRGIERALRLVLESKRLDAALVDRVVQVLDQAGFDSLAVERLRPQNA